jgi:hypothetical protein
MKKYLVILMSVLSFGAFAQKAPASPPAVVIQKVGNTEVMVKYAKPSVKGRLVFGTKEQKALVPYGEVWRTGANDATIQGKPLAKGVYSLFSIPGTTEWTVIFNSDAKQWGAYTYKAEKDVLRVTGKVSEHAMTEQFNISVSPQGQISLDWDKSSVSIYVK